MVCEDLKRINFNSEERKVEQASLASLNDLNYSPPIFHTFTGFTLSTRPKVVLSVNFKFFHRLSTIFNTSPHFSTMLTFIGFSDFIRSRSPKCNRQSLIFPLWPSHFVMTTMWTGCRHVSCSPRFAWLLTCYCLIFFLLYFLKFSWSSFCIGSLFLVIGIMYSYENRN